VGEKAGQLAGKVAIITGGASGIGAASAETLAQEGASVVVTDIDIAGGEAVAQRIGVAGGAAIFLPHDVTDEARWAEVVAETEHRHGRLDVLVANAGIGILCPVSQMSLVDWRRQTAVNLDGVFLGVKHALPAMRRTGGGSIVITSSLAGLRGAAGLAGYCATKGAVRLFAKAVALECAAMGDAIRVNTIHPGVIDTPIWGKVVSGGTARGTNTPIDPTQLVAGTPLGRTGTAREVANGVLFLASDASSYMTAAELVIDGGAAGGWVPRRSASPARGAAR
jgi:NAD(P)-dependent dehydrogenase (short-subunit alcohol dehydrogenase family)